MEKKTIGKFISALRKANGMTQKELGDKLYVSDKTVSRWECDECTPELSLIPSIAEIFGITTDELLRGERNNPDREATSEDVANKQKAKSEKQFKLMLHSRKKKFTNLSFISIGLTIVGLIAAMICNLGFSKGLLGFCLASVFFVAATICQICFTVSFRLLIDEEEAEHAEEIKKANTDMVFSSVKIFFAILLTFAFCLPIAVITLEYFNSYYGLVIDSWILFGTMFAVAAFLVAYCIYKLIILKVLIKKEFVYLNETEVEKLTAKNKVLKKCCTVYAIIFAVIMVGLISVSIADENGLFTEKVTFTDPDEFIEYVQNQYDEWYEEGYGDMPNGDAVIIDPDLDKDFSYSGHPNNWGKIDGKDYYYQPNLYYILDVNEYEHGKFDITIITNQAHYDATDTYNTFTTFLIAGHFLNLICCSVWYCVATSKKKEH